VEHSPTKAPTPMSLERMKLPFLERRLYTSSELTIEQFTENDGQVDDLSKCCIGLSHGNMLGDRMAKIKCELG
jgi:hypothetical protein